MPETGRYLYGIIKSNEKTSFSISGINDVGEIYTVPHGDIACVVGNSSVQDYSSMPKEALGRLLVKHQAVIEKIMNGHAIIPMKFGTCVSDDDEVREVLKRGYPQFEELLINMEGNIELDVVVTWNDLNSVIKKIGEENNQIKTFKEQIANRPPEETLQDRIKIGSMIKDAVDEKRTGLQSEMLDFLKEKAVDFQKHELLLDFGRHELMDDKIILNCAFLLGQDKEKEFDQALNELNTRFNEEINFKCVGPLPPYSFSTIELKKAGYAEINEARILLELGEETTAEEIKNSYRKKTLDCHPDKDPDDPVLAEKFEEITKAYKMLISFCRDEKCSFKPGEVKDVFLIEVMKI